MLTTTLAPAVCVNCHRRHFVTVTEGAFLIVRPLYRILCRACSLRLTPRRSEV